MLLDSSGGFVITECVSVMTNPPRIFRVMTNPPRVMTNPPRIFVLCKGKKRGGEAVVAILPGRLLDTGGSPEAASLLGSPGSWQTR